MKHVFHISEIEGLDKNVFGRKARNLATLYKMDKSIIPEAVIVDKDVSKFYIETGGDYPKGFDRDIEKGIRKLEKATKLELGSSQKPLVLAVRVSTQDNIEGLQNFILNIGMNEEVVEGLIEKYGRQKFALETYCRSIYEFATKTLGVSKEALDKQKQAILESEKIAEYNFLDEKHLRELATLYKSVVFQETGEKYPEDPFDQLRIAMETIFDSYDSKTAKVYRKLNSITDSGCSIVIQRMSFGNLGVGSVAGVIESRNPINGEKAAFGEFMHESQGPDMDVENAELLNIDILSNRFPDAYTRLNEVCSGLEVLTKGAVSLDFVIEDGWLNIVDIKHPKTSAKASLSIAADMLREEIIDTEEALNSLDMRRMDQVFYPEIDPRSDKNIAFKGLSASNGIVQGALYFSLDRIQESQKNSILILEDVAEIDNSTDCKDVDGFMSINGGVGSYVAEHSRNNGKPCIVRCNGIDYVNWKDRYLETSNGIRISEGTLVTLDANTGEVLIGNVLINQPDITANLKYILTAADQASKIKTYIQADNKDVIEDAKRLNMSNVGYFNLGNFLLDEETLALVQDKVFKLGLHKFSDLGAEITTKLKNRIKSIFYQAEGGEINFILFDKGVTSLIPSREESDLIADRMNVDENSLYDYFTSKCDRNPDFGINGAKMYTEYPELFKIQVRAVIEAAIEIEKDPTAALGKTKITLPGVSNHEEVSNMRRYYDMIKSDYTESENLSISFGIKADNLRVVLGIDMFTNYIEHLILDLEHITASLYGITYEDGYRHIHHKNNRFEYDPFERLDVETLSLCLSKCVDKFKGATKGDVGVIGQQVLNPVTLDLLDTIGVDYVITTYKNNLITRLGAAQARIAKFT